MSPGEFAAKLSSLASQIGATTTGMDQAAKILQGRAKEVIGTYDLGWPELAPSTLAKKGADTPLFETGATGQHREDCRALRSSHRNQQSGWPLSGARHQ